MKSTTLHFEEINRDQVAVSFQYSPDEAPLGVAIVAKVLIKHPESRAEFERLCVSIVTRHLKSLNPKLTIVPMKQRDIN